MPAWLVQQRNGHVDITISAATSWFGWFVLPLLIFTARIIDVTLGTVRVIFVAKGMKYLAPLVGFFEILIWLLAIGQIMKNLTSPACYIAYAAGFAAGNFVGIHLAEKMSLGKVLVRAVTGKDTRGLMGALKASQFGVTCLEGNGSEGKVWVIFTIVRRRSVGSVIALIKQFDRLAFYTIEEVGSAQKGVFPMRRAWDRIGLMGMFNKPLRKGK